MNEKNEFIVDSAHNPEGLFTLIDYLKTLDDTTPKENYIIISFKKGRDLNEVFTILASFPAQYIFVEQHHAHEQYKITDLEKTAVAYGLNYQIVENWQFLVSLFQDKDIYKKRYIVTGSIYFIGAFYKMIDYQIRP